MNKVHEEGSSEVGAGSETCAGPNVGAYDCPIHDPRLQVPAQPETCAKCGTHYHATSQHDRCLAYFLAAVRTHAGMPPAPPSDVLTLQGLRARVERLRAAGWRAESEVKAQRARITCTGCGVELANPRCQSCRAER